MRFEAPLSGRAAHSCSTARLRAATLFCSHDCLAGGIQFEVCSIDDHIHVGDLAKLTKLFRRECGVRRPATTQHVNVGDRVTRKAVQYLVGHVGITQLIN